MTFRWLQILQNLFAKWRGLCLTLWLRANGCEVGAGLKCKAFPHFRHVPHRAIKIGRNVTLGKRITFVAQSGFITLGDGVNLTQDIIIASACRIDIGAHTLVAEYVSIRDSSHSIDLGQTISRQPVTSSPTIIGQDVWLGAGARILKGSTVPDGCVIGANSTVLEKSKLKPNHIYVGSPVRQSKARPQPKQSTAQS